MSLASLVPIPGGLWLDATDPTQVYYVDGFGDPNLLSGGNVGLGRPGSFRTVTESGNITAADAGVMIEVDSADAVVLTIVAASTYGVTSAPVWVFRKGAGAVTLTSTSSLYPPAPEISRQYGTLMIYPRSSTEYIVQHDGLAGSVWVP